MALMDEFKEERKAVFENGTLKQKTLYIWDYYKWHIIIPLVIIITVVWYIVHIATAPDIILNGVLMNAYGTEVSTSREQLVENFYNEQEINSKEEEINLNTSMYYTAGNDNANYESLQALMAWHAADSLDFIGGDLPALTELAYRGYFSDLREVLTEEQLAEYEPYFLYMDQDFYTKRSELLSNMEEVSSLEYPDCTKPEEMVDPIPILIDMSQSQKLSEIYTETSEVLAVGITANVVNEDMTLDFIEYLTK